MKGNILGCWDYGHLHLALAGHQAHEAPQQAPRKWNVQRLCRRAPLPLLLLQNAAAGILAKPVKESQFQFSIKLHCMC